MFDIQNIVCGSTTDGTRSTNHITTVMFLELKHALNSIVIFVIISQNSSLYTNCRDDRLYRMLRKIAINSFTVHATVVLIGMRCSNYLVCKLQDFGHDCSMCFVESTIFSLMQYILPYISRIDTYVNIIYIYILR